MSACESVTVYCVPLSFQIVQEGQHEGCLGVCLELEHAELLVIDLQRQICQIRYGWRMCVLCGTHPVCDVDDKECTEDVCAVCRQALAGD